MVVSFLVSSLGNALEAIQIELPLEGGVFGLTEVGGHYLAYELLRIPNDEATAVRLPRHDVVVAGALSSSEHGMELEGELFDYAVGMEFAVLVAGDGVDAAGGWSLGIAVSIVYSVGLGYLGAALLFSS